MSKTAQDERRQHTRVLPDAHHPVEVHLMGADFVDVLHAADISIGGARIIVPHLFAGCDINVPLDIVLKLPGFRSFRIKGVVRHKDSAGAASAEFGVRIKDIGSPDMVKLTQYIEQRLAHGAEA
jgi:hypothetical protein